MVSPESTSRLIKSDEIKLSLCLKLENMQGLHPKEVTAFIKSSSSIISMDCGRLGFDASFD